MAKFVQKPQTIRLVEVYNSLIKKGVVNNQIEFCKQIDYLSTSFNAVLSGRRDIPVMAINKACKTFHINPDYIFDGKQPIFVKNKKEDTVIDNSQTELNLLKIRVEYLERINKLLEDQLSEYKNSKSKNS